MYTALEANQHMSELCILIMLWCTCSSLLSLTGEQSSADHQEAMEVCPTQ